MNASDDERSFILRKISKNFKIIYTTNAAASSNKLLMMCSLQETRNRKQCLERYCDTGRICKKLLHIYNIETVTY